MIGACRPHWLVACALVLPLVLACSALSALPSIAGLPPTPSRRTARTGSSPLSGDWNADTEFGSFAFTVAPDGANVTTAVVRLAGFSCGGSTLTSTVQVLDQWTISDSGFSGDVNLESGEDLYISFDGVYDGASRTFSGSWTEDAYGTECSGDWISTPHE
jgi:hypothetical protein